MIVPARQEQTVDIAIAGAGLAGLIGAARLGWAGFRVTCIEKHFPPSPDPRTTALFEPALACLAQIGLWPALEPVATPLKRLSMVEADCALPVPRPFRRLAPRAWRKNRFSVPFDAGEIRENGTFGYNIPNALLRKALFECIGAMENVSLHAPARVCGWTSGEDGAYLSLSSASPPSRLSLRARLILAADGARSPMRARAGIAHHTVDYRQKALLFSLTPVRRAQAEAIEIMAPMGEVLTLVPTHEGDYACIWLAKPCRADALMDMNEAGFSQALHAVAKDCLGAHRLSGKRQVIPVRATLARRLVAPRLALMAEAAHALAPIGAQGLNLSIGDVTTLARILETARRKGEDIGADAPLARYERARMPEILVRAGAVHLLNRTALGRPEWAGFAPLRAGRSAALSLLGWSGALRRALMRAGMR